MRADVVVAAVWGFAEATLFFVVPDVPVGWVALRRPRRAIAAWLAALLGAVAGAAVLHRAVSAGWEPERRFRSLPGTQAGDLERVRSGVERDPVRAFLVGSFSGLPVKFHVAEGARQGLRLRATLVLVVANRAPRIAAFGLSLAMIGIVARQIRPPSRRLSLGAYAVGWAVFYGWYWVLRTAPMPSARDARPPTAAAAANSAYPLSRKRRTRPAHATAPRTRDASGALYLRGMSVVPWAWLRAREMDSPVLPSRSRTCLLEGSPAGIA